MRRDDWAAAAPISFAIAGTFLLAALGTVLLTTQSTGTSQENDSIEAAGLQAQARSVLSILLDSPGYVGTDAWVASGDSAHDSDLVTRPGLLHPETGLLDLGKFIDLRLAGAEDSDDVGSNHLNYPEARAALGLDTQGLDFHIRAYPSLLDARQKLASNMKDENMRIAYIGHVEGAVESGSGTPPTLGALTCTQSPHDPTHYSFEVDIGGLNQHTHLSVSLGIRDKGTGAAVEATDVTEIAPADSHTATFKVDVPNTGNVGCAADTEVQITVSDPSLTLLTSTVTPSPVNPMPTGSAANDFRLSAGLQAVQEGSNIKVSYTGVSKDDDITWQVVDAATGTPVALSNVQNPSPINVPQNSQDRWFSFDAPATGGLEFYRIEATHTPDGETDTETAFRHLAVHDTAITIQPYTDPSGGATTASDAMKREVRWIHDLAGRFCAQAADDPAVVPMDKTLGPQTEAQLNTEVADQCNTRVTTGFGPYPPLSDVGRSGDVYYDTKESANSLCRILLQNQAAGQCDWQTDPGTLDYINLLVIGSEATHSNLVANDFKKSVESWVDAGGTLIVFGSSDSRQWMQSGLGIGHASSSGGLSSPDATHPVLTRPNQLDWSNYNDLGEQWAVDDDEYTSVVTQGTAGDPVTAVSNPGSYGKGNIFLTTWQPHDIYGSGVAPDEGRGLMDNMLTMSYRDLYLDYGPPLPENAPAVPAFGRSIIEHDKLGLIEMDFVLYVFKGS